MKPVVVFALTFIVATAASTAAKVLTTKPAPVAHADSTHVDSTRADSTKRGADSTRAAGPDTAIVASGQTVTPPADSARAETVADTAKVKPLPTAAPAKVVASAAPVVSAPDTVTQASERRIAKVFTSMDAKQAAKVLEHMADGDVQIILGYVGV